MYLFIYCDLKTTPRSLNSWVLSCGRKPNPKSKCYSRFVRQECAVTITDADSAGRGEAQTAAPGITRLPVNPMKLVLGYGTHGTRHLPPGHSAAAGLHWNLCHEMLPFMQTNGYLEGMWMHLILEEVEYIHHCWVCAFWTSGTRKVMANFGPKTDFGVLFGHFSTGRVFWFSQ